MLGTSNRDVLGFRRHLGALRIAVAAVALGLVGTACSAGTTVQPLPPAATPGPTVPPLAPDYLRPSVPVTLTLYDESGIPISGARAMLGDAAVVAGSDGTIILAVDQPVLAIVEAEGYLPEPIVVTPEMGPEIGIRLFGRTAADGTERVALHFGGDFMMGRRYLDSLGGTARVGDGDGGASARQVVAAVAPLFAAADISSVNFESVIGDLPEDAAYPGKRFLLQSPPVAVAALDELGVDVATLGNNHINDWQADGLASTVAALASAQIAAPGAGLDDEEARRPALLRAGGIDVGFLSYTTVTGDFVNDSLPVSGDPIPAGVASSEEWQYEARPFRFVAGDGAEPLDAGAYRAGDAWRAYSSAEPDLTDAVRDELWRALTVADAFPELQDWVARRGHGGAALFRSGSVAEDVAALRNQGADLVVVQIHGGFQFAEVASEFFARAARASVDAGADLVVGHHPHVLQGAEWYNDTLIAHSLGNFVFDQDFLATFPSVVLRTVFEADQLLEAKLYPVVLDQYRPEPASGDAGRRILRMVAERSAADAASVRLPDASIGVIPESPPPGVVRAGLIVENGAATIVAAGIPATSILPSNDPDGITMISGDGLVEVPDDPEVLIGRDLFGWGSFEDVEADAQRAGGVQWSLAAGGPVQVRTAERAPSGNSYLEFDARAPAGNLLARPVARVVPSLHRRYDDNGLPLDAAAEFSIIATVRVEGEGQPFIRLDGYRFVDTDPTRDPESTLLMRLQLALDVAPDGEWHRVVVDLPADVLQQGAGAVNSIMFYLGVAEATTRSAIVGVDDLAFVEWRAAASWVPGTPIAADFLRTSPLG